MTNAVIVTKMEEIIDQNETIINLLTEINQLLSENLTYQGRD